MNPEEIEPNHLYNVRLYFTRIDGDGDYIFSGLPSEPDAYYLSREDVEKYVFPLSGPANGKKNTAPAPKYDPCREFRKGDKVRIVQCKGRHFDTETERLYFCEGIVTFNERNGEYVDVSLTYGTSEEDIEIDPAYLELVQPVEELVQPVEELEQEPHFFISDEFEQLPYYCLYFGTKQNQELAARLDKKYYTLKAAEAERDRLNAEHRKEQK